MITLAYNLIYITYMYTTHLMKVEKKSVSYSIIKNYNFYGTFFWTSYLSL